MQGPDITVARYPPEGKIKIFGSAFLILAVTDDHVCAFPTESGHDPFEAGFLTWEGEGKGLTYIR